MTTVHNDLKLQLLLRMHLKFPQRPACGKRQLKSKGRPAPTHSCSKHSAELEYWFGINISKDDDTIHPSRFCNLCYAIIKRSTKAAKEGIPNRHSTEPFQWEKHSDNCLVRKIGVATAVMYFKSIHVQCTGMPKL